LQLSSTPLLQISVVPQHAPDLHCMLAPQVVPSPTELPVSSQASVVQSSVPVWQGLAGTHGPPGTHAVQLPALQTMPVPHGVPFGAGFPVSLQTGLPVVHEVVPRSHGLPVGLHVEPFAHVVQVPPAQNMLVPHEVPSVTATSVSVHVCVPVVHEVVPTSQGFAGVHGWLTLHDEHTPALQTEPVPHEVPFGACASVSRHCETPVTQLVAP
jgi:hypothetical protein